MADGGHIPTTDRSAFLYEDPRPPVDRFAQCATCVFFANPGCPAIGKKDAKATGSCGLYCHGRPGSEKPAKPFATPEEAGYVNRAVRCEHCDHFDGKDHCQLFATLNRLPHSPFKLDERVHPKGCCNANTARLRRAKGGAIPQLAGGGIAGEDDGGGEGGGAGVGGDDGADARQTPTVLQAFRRRYPMYNDLSDQQLADGLHRKFYSDLPRQAFDAKLAGPAQPPLIGPRAKPDLAPEPETPGPHAPIAGLKPGERPMMPTREPEQPSYGENLKSAVTEPFTRAWNTDYGAKPEGVPALAWTAISGVQRALDLGMATPEAAIGGVAATLGQDPKAVNEWVNEYAPGLMGVEAAPHVREATKRAPSPATASPAKAALDSMAQGKPAASPPEPAAPAMPAPSQAKLALDNIAQGKPPATPAEGAPGEAAQTAGAGVAPQGEAPPPAPAAEPAQAPQLGMWPEPIPQPVEPAVERPPAPPPEAPAEAAAAPEVPAPLPKPEASGPPPAKPQRQPAAPKRPQNILEFLARNGGLEDDEGGELRAMDAHKKFMPGSGMLVRKQGGMSLDYAREAAEEAGYLPPDSDVNMLLGAIDDNLRGNHVFSDRDYTQAEDWRAHTEGARRNPEMEDEEIPGFGERRNRASQKDFQPIDISGYRRESTNLPDEHAMARSWVMGRGLINGNEHLAVFDHNADQVTHAGTSGDSSFVALPDDVMTRLDDGNERLTVHHNHPQGSPLSTPDMAWLGSPGMQWIIAHGNDGQLSAMRLTDPVRQAFLQSHARTPFANEMLRTNFEGAAMAASNAISGVLMPLFRAKKISAGAANFLDQELTARAMSHAGLVHYLTSHDMPETAFVAQLRQMATGAVRDYMQNGMRRFLNADAIPAHAPRTVRPDEGMALISGEGRAARPVGARGAGSDVAGARGAERAQSAPEQGRLPVEGGTQLPPTPKALPKGGQYRLLEGKDRIDETDQGEQRVIPGAERERPEDTAARQRQQQKGEAELRMRGKQQAKKPQEAIDSSPLFGGKGKQGSLFAPVDAYHGSPHEFDKFDLSKIGTGEGAQAYGHGLYFASRKAIAQHYRESLTSGRYPTVADTMAKVKEVTGVDLDGTGHVGRVLNAILGGDGLSAAEAARKLYMQVPALRDLDGRAERVSGPHPTLEKMVDAVRNMRPRGRLYHVELAPDEHEFLDWDTLHGDQSPKVQAALEKLGIKRNQYEPPERIWQDEGNGNHRLWHRYPNGNMVTVGRLRRAESGSDWHHVYDGPYLNEASYKGAGTTLDSAKEILTDLARQVEDVDRLRNRDKQKTGEDIYRDLTWKLSDKTPEDPGWSQAYGNGQSNPAAASKALKDAGIPGIRYLDAGSRNRGEGSHNYVLFDDSQARIKGFEAPRNRYGAPVQPQAAQQARRNGLVARSFLGKIFSPATVSAAADTQAALKREELGNANRLTQQARAGLEHFRDNAPDMKTPEGQQFLDYVEGRSAGVQLADPAMKPLADHIRALNKNREQMIRQFPDQAQRAFIRDYFPHLWKNPAKAMQAIDSTTRGGTWQGSGRNLKQRTVPTIADGLAMGLEPVHSNVVDGEMAYLATMDRFIATRRILGKMQANGTAQHFPAGKQPDGWVPLRGLMAEQAVPVHNGRSAPAPSPPSSPTPASTSSPSPSSLGAFIQRLYAPEDVARVYNNSVSQGVYGTDAGPIYDKLLRAKNGMTQAELSFSAFHAMTMTWESMASEFARGYQSLLSGHPLRGATQMARSPTAVGMDLMRGRRAAAEYLQPGSQGADLARQMNLMTAANAAAPIGRGAQQYFTAQKGAYKSLGDFKNAMLEAGRDVKGHPLAGPFRQFTEQTARIMDTASAPLFDYAIPRIKAGAALGRLSDWLADHPNASLEEQTAKAREISDSIDNRFGEMNYDNLAWHTGMKQAAFLAMRAFGWALGTWREIGGGAADIARGRLRTERAAYVAGLAATTAATNALLTYAFTGKAPQSPTDLMAYNHGTTDDRGNSVRGMIPGYAKEVATLGANIRARGLPAVGSYLYGKSASLWQLAYELMENRDYRDDPIGPPEAGITTAKGRQQLPEFIKRYATEALSHYVPMNWREALGVEPGTQKDLSPAETTLAVRKAPFALSNPSGAQRFFEREAQHPKGPDEKWKLKMRRERRAGS